MMAVQKIEGGMRKDFPFSYMVYTMYSKKYILPPKKMN